VGISNNEVARCPAIIRKEICSKDKPMLRKYTTQNGAINELKKEEKVLKIKKNLFVFTNSFCISLFVSW